MKKICPPVLYQANHDDGPEWCISLSAVGKLLHLPPILGSIASAAILYFNRSFNSDLKSQRCHPVLTVIMPLIFLKQSLNYPYAAQLVQAQDAELYYLDEKENFAEDLQSLNHSH